MNFTLALLAGLVLILPGITALAAWNFQGAAQGARRPELQLTSISALFIALAIALLMHLLGFALTSLAWSAARELGAAAPSAWPKLPLIANPYETAISLGLGRTGIDDISLLGFVLIVL